MDLSTKFKIGDKFLKSMNSKSSGWNYLNNDQKKKGSLDKTSDSYTNKQQDKNN